MECMGLKIALMLLEIWIHPDKILAEEGTKKGYHLSNEDAPLSENSAKSLGITAGHGLWGAAKLVVQFWVSVTGDRT